MNLTRVDIAIITSRKTLFIFGSMSSIRQKDEYPFEREIDENRLTKPCEAVEAFAVHFRVSSTGAAFVTSLLAFRHLIHYT
jgi:hypothetical protein